VFVGAELSVAIKDERSDTLFRVVSVSPSALVSVLSPFWMIVGGCCPLGGVLFRKSLVNPRPAAKLTKKMTKAVR